MNTVHIIYTFCGHDVKLIYSHLKTRLFPPIAAAAAAYDDES